MSLIRSILTDRQAKLFRWLFGQPERSFYLNELLRLTKLSSASLQQELKRLTEAGLVDSSRFGNLRVFKANPNSPVFHELISLTRKTGGLTHLIQHALSPMKPSLQQAWIYGSVAKETDTSASDIDLMLVGEKISLSEVLTLFQPLEEELKRKVNPTCYTPKEFAQRIADADSFASKVMSQPHIDLLKE
jgi:predicted nucleotidyltransferase